MFLEQSKKYDSIYQLFNFVVRVFDLTDKFNIANIASAVRTDVVSIIKFNVPCLVLYTTAVVLQRIPTGIPVYDGCYVTHHYHHIKDKNNYLTAWTRMAPEKPWESQIPGIPPDPPGIL